MTTGNDAIKKCWTLARDPDSEIKTVTLDILPSRPKDATHLVSFSKNNISLTDKISSGMPHETVSVENVGTAPNLLIHFPVVCEFIEDAVDKGCKVLVCYEDGTSPDWAGTVVAAYLMAYYQKVKDAAIAAAEATNPHNDAFPTQDLLEQLVVWGCCNRKETYEKWHKDKSGGGKQGS